MTGTCCFCGAVEELPPGVAFSVPLVCERPECLAKGRQLGFESLLAEFIETKPGPDGSMMFRLKDADQ